MSKVRSKVKSVDEAIKLIKNGDTIAVSGFVGFCNPEEITGAIEKNFLKTGSPNNLVLVFGAGQGNGKNRGMNHFAHEGLVRRVIGGHWNLSPKLGQLALDNKCEAYNFPQGIITHLFRDIAAGRPGLISHVGLNTFVDPRVDGGKINSVTKEDLVEVMKFYGREWLFYKAFPINVGIIRGTTADENGNITMEKEGLYVEALPVAQAAKNSGGIVIAQVERVVKKGELNSKHVKIPGIYVDAIVVADPQNHWQTNLEQYSPYISGELIAPNQNSNHLPLSERKVIARRAAMELTPNTIVNLGIGIPDGIAAVAAEEGIKDRFTLTVEAGPIGGTPTGGLDFGGSINAEAIIEHQSQFDFYDGGGLDVCFLGMAQVDKSGNVNVSRFKNRIAGCGGFINISQNTKKVVFCGTLTGGGLEIEIANGNLKIINEGKEKKFVNNVMQITFSGQTAKRTKQEVIFITERAVFQLKQGGLVLTEIAPGVDLEKDIKAQVEFPLMVSKKLKLMDTRIFQPQKMNLQ